MSRTVVVLLLVQAALVESAMALSVWVQAPVLITLGLGLVGASALVATLAPAPGREPRRRWSGLVAWGCSLLLLVGLMCSRKPAFALASWYFHCAVLAGIMAGALLPAGGRIAGRTPSLGWLVLLWFWAFLGVLFWLGAAYVEPGRWAFCLGLLLAAGLLQAFKSSFRLAGGVIQGVNTLILLAMALPLLDLALHPPWRAALKPEELRRYYSYHAAKQNRAAFAQWCRYYSSHMDEFLAQTMVRIPWAETKFRLRPNTHGTFLRDPVSINSRGFRGREFAVDKGAAYRIVALGESTTFGWTIDPGDKPWPELLENRIREQLHPHRPVEVINAGVPGATLADNLRRLATEILPLKPDLIICYHGINGFYLMDKAMPPMHGRPPPTYQHRALQVLGDCEYRLRLLWYNHQTAPAYQVQPTFTNILDNDYARAYRQLIHIAQTNHIRLVIATFPLAVNTNSPPELVDFFRARHPTVMAAIRGNVAHGLMVQALAREFPEVCLVDTRPGLDGQEEKYIDLMHVTQEGDRLVAEAFFAGISNILQQDFSASVLRAAGP